MNGRVLLSLVGLVVIGIAFFIIFEYPGYADYAFYILILWMITNFVLLYAIRPRPSAASTGGSPEASPFPSQPGTAPLPSSNPTPTSSVGFCIYCATPVAPGTRACPACGHALPQW